MILNLFTPLFRLGNIKKVIDSIPPYDDIYHIVIISNERFDLIAECQQYNVNYILMDAPDNKSNISTKVNLAIQSCKDGFFFGLDDDTTFNHNTYDMFKKYKDIYTIVVGKQMQLNNGIPEIRLNEAIPDCCVTDGAQAIIHTNIAKSIKFINFEDSGCADGLFLKECWFKSDEDKRLLTPEVISNYNFLR